MSSKTPSLSRRSFLQGMGALGAASAGAALMAAASGEANRAYAEEAASTAKPGEADIYTDIFTVPTRNIPVLDDPSYMTFRGEIAFEDRDIDDSEITRTEEADVVVVGLGISGICTVLSAAEAGATVYGLEKMDKARAVFECMGVAGSGTVLGGALAEANIDAPLPVKYMTGVLEAADYRVNSGPARLWATKSGEAADWLQTMLDKGTMNIKTGMFGRSMAGLSSELPTEISFHSDVMSELSSNAGGAALYVVPDLANAALTYDGVTLAYNSPAVQLISSDSGVTGVIAKDENGYFRINAAKGVVMAAGGYDANPDMLKAWCRNEDIACASSWNPALGATGDGHMMGLRVGASMDPVPHTLMNFPCGNPRSGYGTQRGLTAALVAGFITNQNGKRFCNERLNHQFVGNAFSAQKDCGKYLWSICDSTMIGDPEKSKPVIDYFEELGFIKQADTIEDLAKQIDIPADALKATTEQYNGFVADGVDTEFGRPMQGCKPVATAPFYAMRHNQTVLTTVSGLIVDEQTRVLDWNQDPVPGLYAAGNNSGGMFYGNYPRQISGLSIGRAVTFGMTAGRAAAKGE